MTGYFYEKNVKNLITFLWHTVSALPSCYFVGRQEKMFKFLFVTQSLEFFYTLLDLCAQSLKLSCSGKTVFTFLISCIVCAPVTEIKPGCCYIISSIKSGQLWFSPFWGLAGVLRLVAHSPSTVASPLSFVCFLLCPVLFKLGTGSRFVSSMSQYRSLFHYIILEACCDYCLITLHSFLGLLETGINLLWHFWSS